MASCSAAADSNSTGCTLRCGRVELRFSAEDEAFRREARAWLTDRLAGEFAGVRGRGGPGDEHELFEERAAWERALGEAGWIGIGWPREYGGGGDTVGAAVARINAALPTTPTYRE